MRKLSYANVMSTAAMFVALGGVGYAVSGIPDASGVFHGCVSRATGALRVVAHATACHHSEFAIKWNQPRRPKGPAGGALAGSYPNPVLGSGVITPGNLASANLDGAPGTFSLRTLGTGAHQAAAGNDPRLSTGVVAATQPLPGSFPHVICGSLPVSMNFTKQRSNTDLLITWSGSGFRTTQQGGGPALLTLQIDGGDAGDNFDGGFDSMYMNNTNEHLAFPTMQTVQHGLPAGQHTLSIIDHGNINYQVTTDGNDCFPVTIVEFKPNP